MALARAAVRRTLVAVGGPAMEARAHAAYHRLLRATHRFAPPESPDTLSVLGALAGGSRTVLDVGANVGRYSHFFRSRAPAARIYAFEPNPAAAALLRKTLAGDAYAVVCAFALGETNGEALLEVPRDRMGVSVDALSHIVGVAAAGRNDCLTVTMRRLDDLAETGAVYLEGPVFIKLDVEGSECGVLDGARQVLDGFRPSIYFESQGDDDCRRRLYRALTAARYAAYRLEGRLLTPIASLPAEATNCFAFPIDNGPPPACAALS